MPLRPRFSPLFSPLLRLSLPVLLIASVGSAWASDTLRVRRSVPGQLHSTEQVYQGEVIELLLEKSKAKYGPYVLETFVTRGMTQSRVFRELQAGKIDVATSMTDDTREQMAIPIRYCLYRGLLGVRVGMGLPTTVEALDKIQTREELNKIELGQVFDWPDYTVQNEAGLKVTRLTDFNAGIKRIQDGSLPLMPLGIVEVAPIAKARGLVTISNWAIAYPTAYYIFVSKNRPELAERLRYGFEQAIKDHSFDALFNKRIGTLVNAAGLDKRKLFYVPNPYLPKATPLERKELWHPLVLNKLQ